MSRVARDATRHEPTRLAAACASRLATHMCRRELVRRRGAQDRPPPHRRWATDRLHSRHRQLSVGLRSDDDDAK
eukprot:scaffold2449_cov340-Prasinococcus_capsulatus_cf.AAC.4